MTTTVLSVLALGTVLPYGSIVSEPGTYTVMVQNTNKFGAFHTGQYPANGTVQFRFKGSAGWHGLTLWTDSDRQLVRTSLDGSKAQLDSLLLMHPDPYYRTMEGRAMGAYQGWTWPAENALTIKAKGTYFVKSHGSPARCLKIEASDVDVTVDAVQGSQSNLIQDLSAVYVKGDRVTVRGAISSENAGLFVEGDDCRALNLQVLYAGILDDAGAVYLKGGSDGFRATNVNVWMPTPLLPSSHMRAGFYADDRASNAVIYECTVIGSFDHAVFSHGGSNNRVERLRSLGPTKGVTFTRHFSDPVGYVPPGNRALQITESK